MAKTGGGVSVGNLMAYLGLDDSDFRQGLKGAQHQLKTTTSGLKGIGAELGLAFGAAGIILGIGAVVKKIYSLGVAQEQINTSFAVFLGSTKKAAVLIGDLTKLAAVTPFTSTEIFQAAKALLAFGLAGDKIQPTLKMLGDISAGTGKNLAELAVIYGQIKTAGRLMGQDLLQLINAGFNPLTNIAQKTGKSMLELRKDMEKGAISFEMVEQAFVDATSEGGLFFNMMEKQSKTVGGKMSTLLDNIENIGKGLFAANSGPLKEFIESLVDITSNVDDIVWGLQKWLELVLIIPTTTFKVAKAMVDVNKQIKNGTIGLMGFSGIKISEPIKDASLEGKKLTDTFEETKQAFLALEGPVFNALDTIAEYEDAITKLKEESRHATIGTLIVMGDQLRNLEAQKQELEDILNAEGRRPNAGLPDLPTKVKEFKGNPFSGLINGAAEGAKAYAALILKSANFKIAQEENARASINADAKLHKQIEGVEAFGSIMGSTVESMISGQQSFADVMKSSAIQIIKAIQAIIIARLIEKAVSKSITIWDAIAGVAAAVVVGGIATGILNKSLQGLASGGFVTSGGAFQLHKDEVVSLPAGSAVTPARMANAGGGGNLTTEINLRKLVIQLDRERERMGRG